jgi:hypothetical protein
VHLVDNNSSLDHSKIWDNIDRVVLKSKMNQEELLDIFDMTLDQYKESRLLNRPVAMSAAMSFAERFNIDMSSLIFGDIDISQIENPDKTELRPRYSINPFSKCRTIKNQIDYIEKEFGWKLKTHILNRFQVSEESLLDLDKPINLKLSADIGNYFLKYFKEPEILREMGRNAVNTNMDADFAIDLVESRNVLEVYENMFNEVIPKNIEVNYKWQIKKASSRGLLLEGIANEDVVKLLGFQNVCGDTPMFFREGFFSSVPAYINLPNARVNRIESVFHGNSKDLFEIQF